MSILNTKFSSNSSINFTIKTLFILFFLFLHTDANTQTLKVLTENLPPYNCLNSNNKITGISTQIIQKILDKAKIKYTIEIQPWKRAYTTAQTEKNVLLYTIYRSKERENLFNDWLGPISPPTAEYLYKLKKREDINLNSISDAKKYKIGVVRDYAIIKTLKNMGIDNIEVANSQKLNVKKFLKGRFDLLASVPLALKSTVELLNIDNENLIERAMIIYQDKESKVYSVFSKGTNQEIINKTIKAYDDLRKEDFIQKAYSSFLRNKNPCK